MSSLGPNNLLAGAANVQEWAHCICSCHYQQLHLGPIIFPEVLPMPRSGPIALAAIAANGYALAH